MITLKFKYFPYFIDIQNVIPVCVSPNGLDYIHEKNMTLKELIKIKDVCKNHPSDHCMLAPGTIKQLGININGSTIKAYTQANYKKYVHLLNVSYLIIMKIQHPSSRIGSSKRENITVR